MGVLPREQVCTSNLTPWRKLLPCKGHAGLATLLDGPALFASPFVSIATRFRVVRRTDDPGSVLAGPGIFLGSGLISAKCLAYKQLHAAPHAACAGLCLHVVFGGQA